MAHQPCSVCNDTGWVLKNSHGRIVAARCRCFEKRKGQILLRDAEIPKRYANCSFNNFEIHNDSHKHAIKIAKQFVKNYPVQDVGLLFIGPCGVGKTHLAVALINELIQQKRVPCYFCDFRELIRKIQNTYSPNSSLSESEILEPIFRRDVLVLDELGAKRTTAWVEEMVFYIVNHRYNGKKLTVFTSNYPDQSDDEEDSRDSFFKKGSETLVDRIGVRLRSRLYEMCKIVRMEGDDYRQKIKQAGYRF